MTDVCIPLTWEKGAQQQITLKPWNFLLFVHVAMETISLATCYGYIKFYCSVGWYDALFV